jgi:hypothetical protein
MLITIDIAAILLFLIISDPMWRSMMNVEAWKQWRKRNRIHKLLHTIEKIVDKYNLNEVHASIK